MSTAPDDRNPKPIRWLKGEVKSPPFTLAARMETGRLLRSLQVGESFGMPRSRPIPSIGPRCHELRVRDQSNNWRIVYRIDPREILVVDVFAKTTRATPKSVIDVCKKRLRDYDAN